MIHSRLAAGLVFGLALASPAAARPDPCQVEFRLQDKPVFRLTVKAESITGDRNSLNREDDVLYGFVDGESARIRVLPDRIEASLAGTQSLLHIEHGPGRLEIQGVLGPERMLAGVSPGQVTLRDRWILLELSGDDPERPGILTDSQGQVELRFVGCRSTILAVRPELLVLLHRGVLPRLRQLEDLPVHFRGQAHSPGATSTRTSPAHQSLPPSGPAVPGPAQR